MAASGQPGTAWVSGNTVYAQISYRLPTQLLGDHRRRKLPDQRDRIRHRRQWRHHGRMTMPTTTQAVARPTIRQLVEGLGALAVLVCGLVGIPAVLAVTVGWPLPHHLPGGGQVAGDAAHADPGLVLAPPLRVVGVAGLGLFRLLCRHHRSDPCPWSQWKSAHPTRAPQRRGRTRLGCHLRRHRPQPAPRCANWARQPAAPAVAAALATTTAAPPASQALLLDPRCSSWPTPDQR